MTDTARSHTPSPTWAAHAIHREILQLIVLVLIAAAAFIGTRAVAANNRAMNRQDAAEWYARGRQALASGSTADAVSALRRAATKDRGN